MRIFERIRQFLADAEPKSEHTVEGIPGVQIDAKPVRRQEAEKDFFRHEVSIYKASMTNGDLDLAMNGIRDYLTSKPILKSNDLPLVVAFPEIRQIAMCDSASMVFLPPTTDQLFQIRSQDRTLIDYTPMKNEFLMKLNKRNS